MPFWRSSRTTHAASGDAWQLATFAANRPSFPDRLLAVGSRVLFTAQDGATGQLFSAAPTDAPSPVEALTDVDHFLVVSAHASQRARSIWATAHDGLWASDGTRRGTRRLGDARDVRGLVTTAHAWLFDAAYPEADGRALWRTDGTREGTCMLHGFGRDRHAVQSLLAGDERVTFVSGRRLWLADDSRRPPVELMRFDVVEEVTPVAVGGNGVLAWRAGDGVVTLSWYEPGRSTELLRAAREGYASTHFRPARSAADGSLWLAVPSSLEAEPDLCGVWRVHDARIDRVSSSWACELAFFGGATYAATTTGLRRLDDGAVLCSGTISSPAVAGAWLWFSEGSRNAGWRLFRTDGTRTVMVRAFARDPRLGMNAFPLARPLVAVGERIVFAASAEAENLQLWAARAP